MDLGSLSASDRIRFVQHSKDFLPNQAMPFSAIMVRLPERKQADWIGRFGKHRMEIDERKVQVLDQSKHAVAVFIRKLGVAIASPFRKIDKVQRPSPIMNRGGGLN